MSKYQNEFQHSTIRNWLNTLRCSNLMFLSSSEPIYVEIHQIRKSLFLYDLITEDFFFLLLKLTLTYSLVILFYN